jgi:hypothetical protein
MQQNGRGWSVLVRHLPFIPGGLLVRRALVDVTRVPRTSLQATSSVLRSWMSVCRRAPYELAEAAGTSQAAIARYETGAVLPELRTLARLIDSCGFRLTLQLAPAVRARTGTETAAVRPAVVPPDIDDPSI